MAYTNNKKTCNIKITELTNTYQENTEKEKSAQTYLLSCHLHSHSLTLSSLPFSLPHLYRKIGDGKESLGDY